MEDPASLARGIPLSRRIAIVGTINHDRIIRPDGTSDEGLGGILYNVLSLAPFLERDESILPVARVGEETRAEIGALLSPYPRVDPSGILWNPGGTNETVLRYRSADERDETLIERIAPLREEDLGRAAEADFVLANLIWGKELSPELLRFLARKGARVVLDIQSLTLTFAEAPGRAYRRIPEWRAWCAGVEVLKGNEEEVRWFVGEEGPWAGSVGGALRLVLGAGPRVAIATRGGSGAALAWREPEGDRYAEIPALRVPAAEWIDSTGCGDAFTSGFLLGSLRGMSTLESALVGSVLAAAVCKTSGLRALRALPVPSVPSALRSGVRVSNL
jgi:sugar/nucleoside kinase (ribokinase family)